MSSTPKKLGWWSHEIQGLDVSGLEDSESCCANPWDSQGFFPRCISQISKNTPRGFTWQLENVGLHLHWAAVGTWGHGGLQPEQPPQGAQTNWCPIFLGQCSMGPKMGDGRKHWFGDVCGVLYRIPCLRKRSNHPIWLVLSESKVVENSPGLVWWYSK